MVCLQAERSLHHRHPGTLPDERCGFWQEEQVAGEAYGYGLSRGEVLTSPLHTHLNAVGTSALCTAAFIVEASSLGKTAGEASSCPHPLGGPGSDDYLQLLFCGFP